MGLCLIRACHVYWLLVTKTHSFNHAEHGQSPPTKPAVAGPTDRVIVVNGSSDGVCIVDLDRRGLHLSWPLEPLYVVVSYEVLVPQDRKIIGGRRRMAWALVESLIVILVLEG